MVIPMTGAKKINKMVLDILSISTIEGIPIAPLIIQAWAMAAPAKPPIKV